LLLNILVLEQLQRHRLACHLEVFPWEILNLCNLVFISSKTLLEAAPIESIDLLFKFVIMIIDERDSRRNINGFLL
jgi:hypothetical protein